MFEIETEGPKYCTKISTLVDRWNNSLPIYHFLCQFDLKIYYAASTGAAGVN